MKFIRILNIGHDVFVKVWSSHLVQHLSHDGKSWT